MKNKILKSEKGFFQFGIIPFLVLINVIVVVVILGFIVVYDFSMFSQWISVIDSEEASMKLSQIARSLDTCLVSGQDCGECNQKMMDKKCQVIVDPIRAPIIKKMFEKVANENWSGRKLYNWLRFELNFYTRGNKPLTLSGVYRVLENPFYYGIFERPKESGNWYQGKHTPLITQELFEKVKAQLKRDQIVRETKEFSFTKLFTCGYCGSGISAEEKWKQLKSGGANRYIYYSCSRARDRNCKNKYIREEDLITELLKILDQVNLNELGMRQKLEDEISRFNIFQRSVLGTKEKAETRKDTDIRNYAKYILKEGSTVEKRELLANLRSRIVYKDKQLTLVI